MLKTVDKDNSQEMVSTRLVDSYKDAKVLQLELLPRASTGVIYHAHRTVALTLTAGVVTVLVDGSREVKTPGDTVVIEPMRLYSVINTGSMAAHLVAVITGQYLEEDDVRYVERPGYIKERRRSDRLQGSETQH